MKKYFVSRKIVQLILSSIILLITLKGTSQNTYERRISISEWIDEMVNCKNDLYRLSNTEIYFDETRDTLHYYDTYEDLKNGNTILVEKNIHSLVFLYNCKLPDRWTMSINNLIFHENITLSKCRGANQVIFYNCTFNQGFDLRFSELGILEFDKCSILQRVVIADLQISSLAFSNCLFKIDNTLARSIYVFGDENDNRNYQYLFRIYQARKKIYSLYLYDCDILPVETTAVIEFSGGKYDKINFDNIDFSNVITNFISCTVEESFIVSDCKFDYPFGITMFNFPKNNSHIHWRQLDSIGLAIYSSDLKNYEAYTAKTDSQLYEIDNYNELISSYRKFFTMYRTQGDIESANSCYIRMKDIETRRQKYLYRENSTLKSWFNWRLNQFLKYFCQYGTSPVQALIFSMWTILGFALFYFFIYSDWDRINREYLIEKHRKILTYLRSKQKLEDFYTDNHKEEFQAYTDYKKELNESKAEVPFYINILGKPLYYLSLVKHKFTTWLYRKTEILHGRWVDLKFWRKIFVGSLIGLSIIFYISFLCFVRALNSTILSINAFSTLGFGIIPVKGFSRYITIIEGFLGWFLLSIFSVSLISQILQN